MLVIFHHFWCIRVRSGSNHAAWVQAKSKLLQGSHGTWGKMCDTFMIQAVTELLPRQQAALPRHRGHGLYLQGNRQHHNAQ